MPAGLGRERVAHRVQAVAAQAVRVRDTGGRGMRQQENGTADGDAEARGGGHQSGHVRGRRRGAAADSDVGDGQFR